MKYLLLIACSSLLLPSLESFACSALGIKGPDSFCVGRNLDWAFGHGLLMLNPRGLHKHALIGAPFEAAEWTAKYGSLTFNQAGRELPYGGVNEAGLDIEALWLDSAVFPAPSQNPTVNELQWVQYQLDNYSTLAELLANLGKLSVTKRFAPLHYFVCDARGACAALEPIAGKLEVRSLSLLALTNSPYLESLAFAGQYSQEKDFAKIPSTSKSLDRFARLAFLLNSKPNFSDLHKGIFEGLAKVASAASNHDDGKTQWSMAADLPNKIVYFKTSDSPTEKFLDLSKVDFDCRKAARVLDINDSSSGNVLPKFVDYSKERNKELVEKSLATGFVHLPPEAVEKIISYPDSLICR